MDSKIGLWRNFPDDKKYTSTYSHWHQDKVMDVAFTVMGITLLSGGHDCVLQNIKIDQRNMKSFSLS
jgi:NET1-associated nuclear protein 1 (U3 small nucleolar RNA-associated protein 17)